MSKNLEAVAGAMTSFGGMVLYILLSKKPIIQRMLSGSTRFIAAVLF